MGNLAAMPKVLILIINKEMEKMNFCFFIYTKIYADCDVALDGFFYHQVLFSGIFSHSLIFFLGGVSLVNVRQNRNEVFAKGFLVTKNYVMELINKKSVGRQDEY